MSESPKESSIRHMSPAQLEHALRIQNVATWHQAYLCPACGFVQSAETMRRAGWPFAEIEPSNRNIRPVQSRICGRCEASVLPTDNNPLPIPTKLIIVSQWPSFEPASPELAKALLESWRKA